MVTQSQFINFLSDIEPSPTTKNNCSSAHIALRRYLETNDSYKTTHLDTQLSGSYKRDTAIRPKEEKGVIKRPDVDILVITNHTLMDKPVAVINQLHNILHKKYDMVTKQARSVHVETTLVDMDVVPVIAPYGIDNTWYIADRKQNEWLITNPRKQIENSTDMNNKNSGKYKPLVKLFKWWRRENPTLSKRPKGYALEVMVAENIDSTISEYGELFAKTLENMVASYAFSVATGKVPFVSDPGVPTNSVLANISFSDFSAFFNKLSIYAKKARGAVDNSDSNISPALWRELFGPRFPSSSYMSSSTTKSANVSNYEFPNKPLKPSGPAGFGVEL